MVGISLVLAMKDTTDLVTRRKTQEQSATLNLPSASGMTTDFAKVLPNLPPLQSNDSNKNAP